MPDKPTAVNNNSRSKSVEVQYEAEKKLTGMDRDCQDKKKTSSSLFILSLLSIPV
jgi:hypothetical protein